MIATNTSTAQSTAKVTVVGLGNIGTAVVPQLARLGVVNEVTLIDFDSYDDSNLASQEILTSDVSRPKALVQGRRMQHIAPGMHVDCLVERLENVPWGTFRSDVILACLDTRLSRIHVNEIAWRLNVPWIDAAVDAENWLARVNVYWPGSPSAPCYECSFTAADYDAVEQTYPCQPNRSLSVPTNAPSFVGAVAAAMQVAECQKLLSGDRQHLLAGRQVLIDLRHNRHFVTQFRRNPACRFDHRSLQITRLNSGPGQLTVGDAVRLVEQAGPKLLYVPGHQFVRRVVCTGCLQSHDVLRLRRRLLPKHVTCSHCGGELEPVGFDLVEWLDVDSLDRRARRRTLRSLGLRPRDLLAIRGDDEQVHYFELGELP